MPTTTFAKLLQEGRPDLHQHLEQMRNRAFEDWIHLLKPDAGSHAGYVHLSNVERNADKLIPDSAKTQFSHGEMFLLLSSILLHDLGRILPDRIFRTCPATNQWQCDHLRSGAEPCPLQPGCTDCQDSTRSAHRQGTHACLSKSLIDRLWSVFALPDGQIAEYCALLAFWHQLTVPPNIASPPCAPVGQSAIRFEETSLEPYGPLRLPLLAAILRVADETENCWTRAIRQHWYDEFLHAGQTPDQIAKAFRRGILDIEFCHDGNCLIMYVPQIDTTSQPARPALDETSIKQSAQRTQAILDAWGQYLAPAAVRYERVFVHRNRRFLDSETLNQDQPMSEVFEKHGYLPKGRTECYFDAIVRLARGTYGHQEFPWGAIEGVIHEPLTPKLKWVIRQIGGVSEHFSVIPNDSKGTVLLKLVSANVLAAKASIVGRRKA